MTSAQEISILVFANVEDRHVAQIQAVDPRLHVTLASDNQRGIELAHTAEIMVGSSVPREAVQRAPKLRWIHSTAAGVDQLLHPEVIERNLIITDSSGIHQSVVEHVYAFILAFSRRLHIAMRDQLKRRWERGRTVGHELSGKTLGILGLGTIGAEIAHRAAAFGLHVIGTKRTHQSVPGVDRVLLSDGMGEVLRESDIVVIALPFTRETAGLIGEPEFRMMKRSALFINVARGGIVQEAALIRALREGWIEGAALDVFEREPLAQDSPLYEFENVIITPHVSGASPSYMDRAVPLFCENLRRYIRKEPLLQKVDREVGY